eukprot:12221-Heterococcus_DN1.PRE.3
MRSCFALVLMTVGGHLKAYAQNLASVPRVSTTKIQGMKLDYDISGQHGLVPGQDLNPGTLQSVLAGSEHGDRGEQMQKAASQPACAFGSMLALGAT